MEVVIVGGGIAGVRAAEALKEWREDADVTIVTREGYTLYSRPAIYEVLSGKKAPEDLVIHGPGWFRSIGISLIERVEVESIDPDSKKVRLATGEYIKYDKLVLATGSKPIRPPIEGVSLRGIHGFYTIDDALALAREIHRGSRVLVVGAGPVGLKVAESVIDRYGSSVEVTVVEKLDRPLPRFLDPEAGRLLAGILEEHGVKLRLSTSVVRFEGEDRLEAAVLDNGEKLDCDVAVIAVGVSPDTGLAERAGLAVSRGILVNPRMETSHPDIYAAGDVAEVKGYDPPVNPVWPVAYEQGSVAGLNIAGIKFEYRGFPLMNAQTIFGIPIISFGYVYPPPPGSSVKVYKGRGEYVKVVAKEGRVLGAILIGIEDAAGTLFNLVASETVVPGLNVILESRPKGFPEFLGHSDLLRVLSRRWP